LTLSVLHDVISNDSLCTKLDISVFIRVMFNIEDVLVW
jgi:hypothetical protein